MIEMNVEEREKENKKEKRQKKEDVKLCLSSGVRWIHFLFFFFTTKTTYHNFDLENTIHFMLAMHHYENHPFIFTDIFMRLCTHMSRFNY